MTDAHLQRLLERTGDDGRIQAEDRAWPVIHAAYSQSRGTPARPIRPRLLSALAAAVALCLVVAVAATTPGAAVAEWVRDHIVGKPGVKQAAPALTHLPGRGRMVVSSPGGVWVVNGDGSRRLLRGYAGATWSPRGLYLAAWRGRQLFAIEPRGAVHWSLARRDPIGATDWSPDGYRIAYLSGTGLRVVAGDGTGDAQLRARVAPVAPAWKPHAPHLLAFAPRARVIDVVATDAAALAWRATLPHSATAVAWSPDGRALAVAGRSQITILDGSSGSVRRRIQAPAGFRFASMAFAHRGRRLAMTVNSTDGRARALAVDLRARESKPRRLFAGMGAFATVRWSPDDRWVLISWPAANQWLFLRAASVSGVSAVRDIARQFDPGARHARFPAVADWCCAH